MNRFPADGEFQRKIPREVWFAITFRATIVPTAPSRSVRPHCDPRIVLSTTLFPDELPMEMSPAKLPVALFPWIRLPNPPNTVTP